MERREGFFPFLSLFVGHLHLNIVFTLYHIEGLLEFAKVKTLSIFKKNNKNNIFEVNLKVLKIMYSVSTLCGNTY